MEKQYDKPDYVKIYSDIIRIKYPEKYEICKDLLSKKQLDALEVITLNDRIFGIEKKDSSINGNFRSYDTNSIFKILDYQKKFNLTNIQLAKHFGLSRNTVTKWKKSYSV